VKSRWWPRPVPRRCDRRGNLRYVADRGPEALDRRHRVGGQGLTLGDLAADLAGLCGLGRQRRYFGGHHRKSPAGIACARGFDGRVERQEIGLRDDAVDEIDDVPDLGRRVHRSAEPEPPLQAMNNSAPSGARGGIWPTLAQIDG